MPFRNIPNPPTENPGEGMVWMWNLDLEKYDKVREGSTVSKNWPYVERASSAPSTPPTTAIGAEPPPGFEWVPGGGQYPALRPIAETAKDDQPVDEPTDKKDTTPGVPVEKIDWEAIVAAIEVDALQAAKELYGGYYGIIEGNEEIKKLILDAYTNKWTPDRFLAKLKETEWWRTTTDTARQFDINEQLDPATSKKQVDQKALSIQELAMAKGVRLSTEVTSRLAREALRMGWDEITLANSIGAEIVKLAPTTQVSQGYIGDSIRKTALDYGIRLSDSSFSKWTEQILTGQASDQMYKDFLLNQASVMYPTLANGFDRGLTFKQLTDPYAEQAANILEIASNQIDFTDPKWSAAFTSVDNKGNQRQMTMGEWNTYLKTDPQFGYQYTTQARNQAYDLVGRIGRLFGAA